MGRVAERLRIERLLAEARAGRSGVLVVHGEPGAGKTALLEHAVSRAGGFLVVRTHGIPSTEDDPYRSLRPLLAALDGGAVALPGHHRRAVDAAVAPKPGSPPDQFLVGIALLGLMSAAADKQPVLCLADDAESLDAPSARVLTFVARRLAGIRAAVVFAESDRSLAAELPGPAELRLTGLDKVTARALANLAVPGRADEAVLDRIVAETRGIPRALLDAVAGLDHPDRAGGFGMPDAGRADDDADLRSRVRALAPAARRLLTVAAADQTGDLALLWRAADQLGTPVGSTEKLREAGFLSYGPVVRFREPALRARVYHLASPAERRTAHRALAAATDSVADADRRAWHRAHALRGPDEGAAQELVDRVADARHRAGPAAGAAFLRKAATLTSDPRKQAEFTIAAAEQAFRAGASETTAQLIADADGVLLSAAQRVDLHRLRAQVNFVSVRSEEAVLPLLEVARRVALVEPSAAKQACLEVFGAAFFAGPAASRPAAECARQASLLLSTTPSTPVADLLLEGLVDRRADGYSAGVEPLRKALKALAGAGDRHVVPDAPAVSSLTSAVAADLWDDEAWDSLTSGWLRHARAEGALPSLPYALTQRAVVVAHTGDLAAASVLVKEARTVSTTLGHPPLEHASLVVAAWRGHEQRSLESIEQARRLARERGEGSVVAAADYATAVLYNSLGRHGEAVQAARQAVAPDEPGLAGLALTELVEAATFGGRPGVAAAALDRLVERTTSCGTDWALGVEALSCALRLDGPAAEDLYVEAIELLARTRITVQLARAQLLYGEWLRLRGRRSDAREPLRVAHETFASMGAGAFAERALRALKAAGVKTGSHRAKPQTKLTPQEARIAGLAGEGLTNPEIGKRLSLSSRTVEYHLRKVFTKLGVTSRSQLG